MLSLLASPLGRAAGAGLLAMALCIGLYAYAYRRAAETARIEQLQATVDAARNREKINGQVLGMDDYSLCVDRGGLPDQCAQLRGVDKAAKGK